MKIESTEKSVKEQSHGMGDLGQAGAATPLLGGSQPGVCPKAGVPIAVVTSGRVQAAGGTGAPRCRQDSSPELR